MENTPTPAPVPQPAVPQYAAQPPKPGPVVISPNMQKERIWINGRTGEVIPPPPRKNGR